MSEAPPKNRILVIDGEFAISSSITLCLDGKDYLLTSVENAVEGLRALEQETFDLVICDQAMPHETTDALIAAIKSRTPPVPIILVTTQGGGTVDITPYDAFLPQPFTTTQLVLAIEDLLPLDALPRSA